MRKEIQKQMKGKRGITLVALVVTIVVLLILAGITISTLFGENGVIKSVRRAEEEQNIAKVRDIIGVNYLSEALDKLVQSGGTLTEDDKAEVLTEAFTKLNQAGYEIKTVDNSGQTLKGLKMQDTTGKNISTVSLEQGKTTTIKVSLDMEDGSRKNYVKINNKWHEISLINGRLEVSENGLTGVEGQTYTIKLTPPSSGATIKVGETQITVETVIESGADLEITAGDSTGDYNFNVVVEGTEHSVNGKVTVVTNPGYVTKVTVSPTTLTLEAGGTAGQLTATVEPTTALQTVTWESSNTAVATVNETGKVTPGSTAGTATITVKSTQNNAKTATCTVTVNEGTQTPEGGWASNGNGTLTNGSTTVTIGDYVIYDPGRHNYTPDTTRGAGTGIPDTIDYGTYERTLTTSQLATETNFTSWRVLGVNNKGQLELISSKPTIAGYQTLYLANATGYLNAETTYNSDGTIAQFGTIDKFCNELYGKGENVIGARSLNVDDIDKLSKYDKTTYTDSSGRKYGEKWKYRVPTSGSKMQYSKKGTEANAVWSSWVNLRSTEKDYFRMPGSTTVIDKYGPGESPEFEYTYYNYNIADNITTEDGYTSELATTIGKMITNGATEGSNKKQWLASSCVTCGSAGSSFGVRYIYNSYVRSIPMFESTGYFYRSDSSMCVRPVVTLESGVKLTGTGENLGTASNPYTLSK